MFEKAELSLPCPACGHKTKKTVAWVKANDEFTCVCGKAIRVDAKELLAGLKGIDKSVDDLRSKLRGLSKRR